MSAPKARSIFIELIAHVSPEHWDGRLAELAGEDHQLRVRVAALLAAHRKADSFLEQPAAPLPATVDSVAAPDAVTLALEFRPTEQSGVLLSDRYELLEGIGEGGMG